MSAESEHQDQFIGIVLGGVPVQVHFENNPGQPGADAEGRIDFPADTSVTSIQLSYFVFGNAKLLPAGTDQVIALAGDEQGHVKFRVTPEPGATKGTVMVVATLGVDAGLGTLQVTTEVKAG